MITLATLLFIGGLIRVIFGIIWFILLIITLMDLFKSSVPLNTKLLWLIVILLAPVIGCLVYLLWGKYQKLI
ncbi:PLDc N-terminal domain-containing protein [Daejeonella lutea]|uniref:Phospholipase_D-nuclease N-terminal n=1 Tax=Daejeonella lutea TaxID=572036 RepID=A0A1T5DCW1_9SPHI|nr:PLDc N-terminal domain-containing protein [Daejeonella lutea]SKB69592.1 Phospholipase_D-nuclease N-terminal [Daejeonella lutea]